MRFIIIVSLLAGCAEKDENVTSCEGLSDCPVTFAACVDNRCLRRHELPDGFFDEEHDAEAQDAEAQDAEVDARADLAIEPPECREDTDCPDGYCEATRCVEGCGTDEDCPGEARCAAGRCLMPQCQLTVDCEADEACAAGWCVPRQDCLARGDCRCDQIEDCPAESDCEANFCVRREGCGDDDDCGPEGYCDPAGECYAQDCRGNLECEADEFCDRPTGACLEAECDDDDGCPVGARCEAQLCVEGCREVIGGCGPGLRCVGEQCVEGCNGNGDCAADLPFCSEAVCVGCIGDDDCAAGEACGQLSHTCIEACEGPELPCNGVDDDCDEVIDELAPSTLQDCGICGRACEALPNAEVACVDADCAVGACWRGWHDLDPEAEGCEYRCTPTNEGVEQCDGLDNDCDGRVDEDGDEPLGCADVRGREFCLLRQHLGLRDALCEPFVDLEAFLPGHARGALVDEHYQAGEAEGFAALIHALPPLGPDLRISFRVRFGDQAVRLGLAQSDPREQDVGGVAFDITAERVEGRRFLTGLEEGEGELEVAIPLEGVDDNAWHRLELRRSGHFWKVYVDGQLHGSGEREPPEGEAQVVALALGIDQVEDVGRITALDDLLVERDYDGDDHLWPHDNCRYVANPTQKDPDGDGLGSLCSDPDGDGHYGAADACPRVTDPNNGPLCEADVGLLLERSDRLWVWQPGCDAGRTIVGGASVGIRREATLSPDGSKLAYVSAVGLLVSDLDGSNARLVASAEEGRPGKPSWLGEDLIFHLEGQVWIERGGEVARLLPPVEAPEAVYHARGTARGQLLVLNGNDAELTLRNAELEVLAGPFEVPAETLDGDVSPDGETVALGGSNGLQTIALAGGETVVLSERPTAAVAWHPDGWLASIEGENGVQGPFSVVSHGPGGPSVIYAVPDDVSFQTLQFVPNPEGFACADTDADRVDDLSDACPERGAEARFTVQSVAVQGTRPKTIEVGWNGAQVGMVWSETFDEEPRAVFASLGRDHIVDRETLGAVGVATADVVGGLPFAVALGAAQGPAFYTPNGVGPVPSLQRPPLAAIQVPALGDGTASPSTMVGHAGDYLWASPLNGVLLVATLTLPNGAGQILRDTTLSDSVLGVKPALLGNPPAVAWLQAGGNGASLRYTTLGADLFPGPLEQIAEVNEAGVPRLARDDDGNVMVAYDASVDGQRRVFFAVLGEAPVGATSPLPDTVGRLVDLAWDGEAFAMLVIREERNLGLLLLRVTAAGQVVEQVVVTHGAVTDAALALTPWEYAIGWTTGDEVKLARGSLACR